MENRLPENAIKNARERYSELFVARAAVQAIPWVGGSLDTLITGGIARIQLQRIEDFLSVLDIRLRTVEHINADLCSDAFADLMIAALDRSARTRSHAGRSRLAQLIRRQVEDGLPWEDADRALRLTGDLEEMHFCVLGVAMTAPVLEDPFVGLRVVALESLQHGVSTLASPVELSSQLPQYDLAALRMACAELVARGLLRDEGVGRLGVKAMNYFVVTDLAQWLDGWLSEA